MKKCTTLLLTTVLASIKLSIEKFGIAVPDWYVNMPDDRNQNPEEILKLLLGKGLNINQKNKGINKMPDQTPLEVALGGGFGNKEEVILALIANGADVKVESDWYGLAILQAAQIGDASVLKAMIEKGADINTQGKLPTTARRSKISHP
jgi:ankyrin repeat protein